jgi:hypothetical protein
MAKTALYKKVMIRFFRTVKVQKSAIDYGLDSDNENLLIAIAAKTDLIHELSIVFSVCYRGPTLNSGRADQLGFSCLCSESFPAITGNPRYGRHAGLQ